MPGRTGDIMRSSRGLALIALIALVATISACGNDDEAATSSTSTPKGGQTLTVYSGRDEELVKPLIDMFVDDTGIKVDVRYGNTAEMGAQLLEEGNGTPADVFYSQDAGATGALANADLLAPLSSETMSKVDVRYRPTDGDEWVGVTGRARVIVYHPDLVADPPAGVLDLTGPAYKGMVAWVPSNASFQAFVTAMRVKLGEDEARRWLKDMVSNGAKSYESNSDVLDAVNAGDVPIGLINHYYWARTLPELGSDLKAKLIFPKSNDPGALINATTVAITKNGADNSAAQKFVDFLLSAKAQTHFVTATFEYPLVEGVVDPAGVPPLAELEGLDFNLNELESLEATQAMLDELGLLS
ncbi:MAG: iron ABC transporter substrate-binding protein [Aquihabitans sp.]